MNVLLGFLIYQMAKIKCAECGRKHDPDDMELGFAKPDVVLALPVGEQQNRVKGNSDLCVLDGQYFFIRGFLEIPRTDTKLTFAYGLWAKISRRSYKRYLALYKERDNVNTRPFAGQLANQIPGYPLTVGLKVKIQ